MAVVENALKDEGLFEVKHRIFTAIEIAGMGNIRRLWSNDLPIRRLRGFRFWPSMCARRR